MADVDDSKVWAQAAFRYVELAAQQIAHFKNPGWAPPWKHVIPDHQPSPLPPPHPLSDSPAYHLLPSDPPLMDASPPSDDVTVRPEKEGIVTAIWGSRGKRSGKIGLQGIQAARRTAGSPETPFDFRGGSGSGSSTSSGSGGEDGSSSPGKPAKRAKSGEPSAVRTDGGQEMKVVEMEPAPLVFGFPAPKSIRRQGKKKRITELQEEEKLLSEEMAMLQKEVESRRKAHEATLAENQRLKSTMLSLRSQRTPTTAAVAGEKVHHQTLFLLPDLNEPLSENLDDKRD